MALCGLATLLLLASLLVRLGASTRRLYRCGAAVRPVADRARADLAQHLRRLARASHVAALALLLSAAEALAAFALLGARVRGEGLSGRPAAAGADLRLADGRPRARVARARGLRRAWPRSASCRSSRSRHTGLVESFRAQAARSLQVESLGGSLLAAADRLGLYNATVVHRTGHAISYDLVGSLARDGRGAELDRTGWRRSSVLPGSTLRGRDSDPRRLAFAFAAAIAGFLAFTRFFSPQYLVWLVPFVLLLEAAAWVVTAGSARARAGVVLPLQRRVRARRLRLARAVCATCSSLAVFVLAVLELHGRAAKDEDPVLLEHEVPLRVPS